MSLDTDNTKTALQSATILNIIKAMLPQVLFLLGKLTGKTFDIDIINQYIDAGGSVVAGVITLYYAARTIYSRIHATQAITKG